jgi:hypothetical protein
MSFLIELITFMRERKKIWLIPIIIMFLLVGGLVTFTQGTAIAPFVYTLF